MYFAIVEFIYATNIQIILRIFNEIAMFFRRTFNIGGKMLTPTPPTPQNHTKQQKASCIC
jgi:hypothetical protein